MVLSFYNNKLYFFTPVVFLYTVLNKNFNLIFFPVGSVEFNFSPTDRRLTDEARVTSAREPEAQVWRERRGGARRRGRRGNRCLHYSCRLAGLSESILSSRYAALSLLTSQMGHSVWKRPDSPPICTFKGSLKIRESGVAETSWINNISVSRLSRSSQIFVNFNQAKVLLFPRVKLFLGKHFEVISFTVLFVESLLLNSNWNTVDEKNLFKTI